MNEEMGEDITIHDIDRTQTIYENINLVMFHNPLFSSVQGIMVAVEFSKLKRKLKEKCEHYRVLHSERNV